MDIEEKLLVDANVELVPIPQELAVACFTFASAGHVSI